MFFVFVFPSKRVLKSVKRKKYIHTSYIVHNSVDSPASWQKSRALGVFSVCCVSQNSDFLHLHQYGKICDLLINLLQTRFWVCISKHSTQMMFTHCKCKKTLYMFSLAYTRIIQSKIQPTFWVLILLIFPAFWQGTSQSVQLMQSW